MIDLEEDLPGTSAWQTHGMDVHGVAHGEAGAEAGDDAWEMMGGEAEEGGAGDGVASPGDTGDADALAGGSDALGGNPRVHSARQCQSPLTARIHPYA